MGVGGRRLSCHGGVCVAGTQPQVCLAHVTAGTTAGASVRLGCCNTHQLHDFAYWCSRTGLLHRRSQSPGASCGGCLGCKGRACEVPPWWFKQRHLVHSSDDVRGQQCQQHVCLGRLLAAEVQGSMAYLGVFLDTGGCRGECWCPFVCSVPGRTRHGLIASLC